MRAPKQHSRREIQAFKGELKRLLKCGTERQFMQSLREIGILDEHPQFAFAVQTFRALKSSKL